MFAARAPIRRSLKKIDENRDFLGHKSDERNSK